MIDHKLKQKWFEKLQNNESVNVTDLYEYTKIKLKRKRIRKKFDKYYYKYISDEINKLYSTITFSNSVVNTFKAQFDIELDDIQSLNKIPVELVYFDYQYK